MKSRGWMLGCALVITLAVATLADMPSTHPDSPRCAGARHWQCFWGPQCREDCVQDMEFPDAWSSGELCPPPAPLCVYQFRVLEPVGTGYVAVYRPLCLTWCER